MNPEAIVDLLISDDEQAKSDAQQKLKESIVDWLRYVFNKATNSATHYRHELRHELYMKRGDAISHAAAVRVTDFIYAHKANTDAVIDVLRGMLENAINATIPQQERESESHE